MVVITSALITLTGQVVGVLCGTTVSFNGLLARLQSLYPSSGWTDDLLESVLASGKSLGTFSFIGGYAGGPVTGYTLNKNGLKQNYAFNKNFATQCPGVFAKPSCCSAVNQCKSC